MVNFESLFAVSRMKQETQKIAERTQVIISDMKTQFVVRNEHVMMGYT